MSKSGGTGFQTEETTRGRTCVGMSLAISRKGGNPRRSFPGINSHNGVTGPKVIDIFRLLIYICVCTYISLWIVSKVNLIKILCSIVNSGYPGEWDSEVDRMRKGTLKFPSSA